MLWAVSALRGGKPSLTLRGRAAAPRDNRPGTWPAAWGAGCPPAASASCCCADVAHGMEQVSPGGTVPRWVQSWLGAWRGTSLCADPPGELSLDRGLPQPSSALAFGTVWAGFVLSVIGLGQPHCGSSRFIET